MGSVRAADRPGVSVMPLFQDERETVQVESWEPGATVEFENPEGAELLVLEGGFEEGGDLLRKHSWLRLPQGHTLKAVAQGDGARVWIKTRCALWTRPLCKVVRFGTRLRW